MSKRKRRLFIMRSESEIKYVNDNYFMGLLDAYNEWKLYYKPYTTLPLIAFDYYKSYTWGHDSNHGYYSKFDVIEVGQIIRNLKLELLFEKTSTGKC